MRFLKYSLENKKTIKVVLLVDGALKQENIKVTAMLSDHFLYTSGLSKKEKRSNYIDLLASAYARGDSEAK